MDINHRDGERLTGDFIIGDRTMEGEELCNEQWEYTILYVFG